MSLFYPDLSDGAFFEPSGDKETGLIVDLLDIKPGQRAVDLGSGDGKIVVAMAKKGALAFGVEKDILLVEQARKNVEAAGLARTAFIHHANFWDINLSPFQKVVVFQYDTIMERLEKKLLEELSPGSFVVSYYWTFPIWTPEKQVEEVYLYVKR